MLMATACWILIAAFSARRDREVDELEAGCLAGNDADGWWIETYIEKTLQAEGLDSGPLDRGSCCSDIAEDQCAGS